MSIKLEQHLTYQEEIESIHSEEEEVLNYPTKFTEFNIGERKLEDVPEHKTGNTEDVGVTKLKTT